MTSQQRKHVFELLPIALIAAVLVLYIVLSAVEHDKNMKSLQEMDCGWETAVCDTSESGGSRVIADIELDEGFGAAREICFYSIYAEVQVRLNGETIYSFFKPEGERFTKAAPCIWNVVDLPEDSAGAVLEIQLDIPYEKYADKRPDVYCGSAQQIDHFVMTKTVPRFVAALAVLFFGLISSVIALILRFHIQKNTGLYSLSLFILMLSIFLAAQQTTILLVFNRHISYNLVQNVAFLLCPVMYTRYLMRSSAGLQRKIAAGINAVSLFNVLIILILQLMKVRDMPEMMSSTRNLCIIVVAYAFFAEMRGHRKLMIAFWAAIMAYTAYYYYISGSFPWEIYTALYMYLFLMVYRVMSGMVQSKAKEIRLEAALEVSKSEIATIQITSHFFYHTLDSIRALIRLDADKAYKMAGDFAKYIRYRVDGVERLEETVSFSREIRSIRAYTDIKKAQLGDRFNMIFDVETEDFDILPLTVQPLVENAVIHAVQKRREGGEVRLVCRENADGYHIEVADNGPGPGAALQDQQKNDQASTAIRNVNTRLEYYGIPPLKFEKNESGGYTVSLDTPKVIARKES